MHKDGVKAMVFANTVSSSVFSISSYILVLRYGNEPKELLIVSLKHLTFIIKVNTQKKNSTTHFMLEGHLVCHMPKTQIATLIGKVANFYFHLGHLSTHSLNADGNIKLFGVKFALSRFLWNCSFYS